VLNHFVILVSVGYCYVSNVGKLSTHLPLLRGIIWYWPNSGVAVGNQRPVRMYWQPNARFMSTSPACSAVCPTLVSVVGLPLPFCDTLFSLEKLAF